MAFPVKRKEGKAEKKPKTRAQKVAGILSVVLWVAGFLLAFVIKPGHELIWLPDALLLLGFFPLLWIWRPGWPWLVFGILNFAIGAILIVVYYLSDNALPKKDMIEVKHHLDAYHSSFTWMWIGAFATAYGIFRMTKNLVLWVKEKRLAGKTHL